MGRRGSAGGGLSPGFTRIHSNSFISMSDDSQRFVAQHVAGLPRSGIRDFFAIVQQMPDAISLGIGEPDFVTPWHIRESAIYALEQGKTHYTDNRGLLALRK